MYLDACSYRDDTNNLLDDTVVFGEQPDNQHIVVSTIESVDIFIVNYGFVEVKLELANHYPVVYCELLITLAEHFLSAKIFFVLALTVFTILSVIHCFEDTLDLMSYDQCDVFA